MKFNTAIASLMALINEIYAQGSITKGEFRTFITLLNPFAPHITEEMYNTVFGEVLSKQQWVAYDENLCVDESVEIVVQINGKVRAKMTVPAGIDKDKQIELAMADPSVKSQIEGKTIVKQIAVPGKLVNIVVK